MSHRALDIFAREGQSHLPKGIGPDGKTALMIKDIADADGRAYRVEFQSTLDGSHAAAFIRHNPWAKAGQGPNAGSGYIEAHVASDGFVCIGDNLTSHEAADSPYDLDTVIKRVGYFVNAYSLHKETGKPFPNL